MRPSASGKLYVLCGATLALLLTFRLLWSTATLPLLASVLGEDERRVLSFELFSVGGQPVRLLFLFKTVFFFAVLAALSNLTRRMSRRFLAADPRFDSHRIYVVSKILTLCIYGIGLMIGIHVENISLHTFVIVGGTLGVAIGLGLQRTVANLIAGLFLLIEQPVRLGDFIEFGNRSGFVTHVGSSSSRITTPDNATLILPNSDFVAREILNLATSEKKLRLVLPLSVGYGTDPRNLMRTLTELASTHPHVLAEPPPSVLLKELGSSAMQFLIRVWTDIHAHSTDELRSELYVHILSSLAEQDIRPPFPQLDVHLTTAASVHNPTQPVRGAAG